ncbi:N-alpha-acetyltransferase 16, NatA auxiliary subunit [Ancistrocladus abbreviatus]
MVGVDGSMDESEREWLAGCGMMRIENCGWRREGEDGGSDRVWSANEEDEEMAKLLPSQKKRMRQKQRKADARAKKEAESKIEETNASNSSKSGKRHVKAVDPDPHGEKLVQVEDPLMEATKYLKLLQKNSLDCLGTHLLSFEVNMRRQKILLALQALKHLLRLDMESPDSHHCLVKFFNKVSSMPSRVTDAERLVWSVLEAERPSILY